MSSNTNNNNNISRTNNSDEASTTALALILHPDHLYSTWPTSWALLISLVQEADPYCTRVVVEGNTLKVQRMDLSALYHGIGRDLLLLMASFLDARELQTAIKPLNRWWNQQVIMRITWRQMKQYRSLLRPGTYGCDLRLGKVHATEWRGICDQKLLVARNWHQAREIKGNLRHHLILNGYIKRKLLKRMEGWKKVKGWGKPAVGWVDVVNVEDL